MTLISLIEASKDFGIKKLFSKLTLHINERDRLGIIGPNGSGKSTLMNILAGKEVLDSGERRCSARLKMEFVGQTNSFLPKKTVLETVLANCGDKRELLITTIG